MKLSLPLWTLVSPCETKFPPLATGSLEPIVAVFTTKEKASNYSENCLMPTRVVGLYDNGSVDLKFRSVRHRAEDGVIRDVRFAIDPPPVQGEFITLSLKQFFEAVFG